MSDINSAETRQNAERPSSMKEIFAETSSGFESVSVISANESSVKFSSVGGTIQNGRVEPQSQNDAAQHLREIVQELRSPRNSSLPPEQRKKVFEEKIDLEQLQTTVQKKLSELKLSGLMLNVTTKDQNPDVTALAQYAFLYGVATHDPLLGSDNPEEVISDCVRFTHEAVVGYNLAHDVQETCQMSVALVDQDGLVTAFNTGDHVIAVKSETDSTFQLTYQQPAQTLQIGGGITDPSTGEVIYSDLSIPPDNFELKDEAVDGTFVLASGPDILRLENELVAVTPGQSANEAAHQVVRNADAAVAGSNVESKEAGAGELSPAPSVRAAEAIATHEVVSTRAAADQVVQQQPDQPNPDQDPRTAITQVATGGAVPDNTPLAPQLPDDIPPPTPTPWWVDEPLGPLAPEPPEPWEPLQPVDRLPQHGLNTEERPRSVPTHGIQERQGLSQAGIAPEHLGTSDKDNPAEPLVLVNLAAHNQPVDTTLDLAETTDVVDAPSFFAVPLLSKLPVVKNVVDAIRHPGDRIWKKGFERLLSNHQNVRYADEIRAILNEAVLSKDLPLGVSNVVIRDLLIEAEKEIKRRNQRSNRSTQTDDHDHDAGDHDGNHPRQGVHADEHDVEEPPPPPQKKQTKTKRLGLAILDLPAHILGLRQTNKRKVAKEILKSHLYDTDGHLKPVMEWPEYYQRLRVNQLEEIRASARRFASTRGLDRNNRISFEQENAEILARYSDKKGNFKGEERFEPDLKDGFTKEDFKKRLLDIIVASGNTYISTNGDQLQTLAKANDEFRKNILPMLKRKQRNKYRSYQMESNVLDVLDRLIERTKFPGTDNYMYRGDAMMYNDEKWRSLTTPDINGHRSIYDREIVWFGGVVENDTVRGRPELGKIERKLAEALAKRRILKGQRNAAARLALTYNTLLVGGTYVAELASVAALKVGAPLIGLWGVTLLNTARSTGFAMMNGKTRQSATRLSRQRAYIESPEETARMKADKFKEPAALNTLVGFRQEGDRIFRVEDGKAPVVAITDLVATMSEELDSFRRHKQTLLSTENKKPSEIARDKKQFSQIADSMLIRLAFTKALIRVSDSSNDPRENVQNLILSVRDNKNPLYTELRSLVADSVVELAKYDEGSNDETLGRVSANPEFHAKRGYIDKETGERVTMNLRRFSTGNYHYDATSADKLGLLEWTTLVMESQMRFGAAEETAINYFKREFNIPKEETKKFFQTELGVMLRLDFDQEQTLHAKEKNLHRLLLRNGIITALATPITASVLHKIPDIDFGDAVEAFMHAGQEVSHLVQSGSSTWEAVVQGDVPLTQDPSGHVVPGLTNLQEYYLEHSGPHDFPKYSEVPVDGGVVDPQVGVKVENFQNHTVLTNLQTHEVIDVGPTGEKHFEIHDSQLFVVDKAGNRVPAETALNQQVEVIMRDENVIREVDAKLPGGYYADPDYPTVKTRIPIGTELADPKGTGVLVLNEKSNPNHMIVPEIHLDHEGNIVNFPSNRGEVVNSELHLTHPTYMEKDTTKVAELRAAALQPSTEPTLFDQYVDHVMEEPTGIFAEFQSPNERRKLTQTEKDAEEEQKKHHGHGKHKTPERIPPERRHRDELIKQASNLERRLEMHFTNEDEIIFTFEQSDLANLRELLDTGVRLLSHDEDKLPYINFMKEFQETHRGANNELLQVVESKNPNLSQPAIITITEEGVSREVIEAPGELYTPFVTWENMALAQHRLQSIGRHFNRQRPSDVQSLLVLYQGLATAKPYVDNQPLETQQNVQNEIVNQEEDEFGELLDDDQNQDDNDDEQGNDQNGQGGGVGPTPSGPQNPPAAGPAGGVNPPVPTASLIPNPPTPPAAPPQTTTVQQRIDVQPQPIAPQSDDWLNMGSDLPPFVFPSQNALESPIAKEPLTPEKINSFIESFKEKYQNQLVSTADQFNTRIKLEEEEKELFKDILYQASEQYRLTHPTIDRLTALQSQTAATSGNIWNYIPITADPGVTQPTIVQHDEEEQRNYTFLYQTEIAVPQSMYDEWNFYNRLRSPDIPYISETSLFHLQFAIEDLDTAKSILDESNASAQLETREPGQVNVPLNEAEKTEESPDPKLHRFESFINKLKHQKPGNPETIHEDEFVEMDKILYELQEEAQKQPAYKKVEDLYEQVKRYLGSKNEQIKHISTYLRPGIVSTPNEVAEINITGDGPKITAQEAVVGLIHALTVAAEARAIFTKARSGQPVIRDMVAMAGELEQLYHLYKEFKKKS